jgi:signal transduction histidine kinase
LLLLATIVHMWLNSLIALERSQLLLAQQNDQLRAAGIELEQRVQERTRDLETALRERQEAQAALLQAQKMEAIGQLTGSVAHDFNNLLTVIAGNAELLEHRLLAERDRRRADTILQAAARGQWLIRHLLTFARRQMLQPEVLDLRERTRDIVDLVTRSLREDIRIVFAIAHDLWPVKADPAELELALLNIGLNARDAMPSGGVLRVEAHNVAFAEGEDRENGLVGEYVALTLSDSGTGIDPETLVRVFEPFFTTKEVGKGTGLGLSQVYGFAKQSGGTVSIRSDVGRGTEVTLYLQRAGEPARAARPPARRPPLARRTGRVLYVEDSRQVAAVTEEMLKEIGYEVHRVDGAQAALHLIDDGHKFDLVLSDILMPGGMNGLDLAREIRRRLPMLPVLLTSGYSEGGIEAERSGFMILAKPYRAGALADAIARCLAPK